MLLHNLTLCYCPEHYNHPALLSSLGPCSTQMHPWNNQSKDQQFHTYNLLHNLKNAPESCNFNQDFVAICVHLYHPAAAVTPGGLQLDVTRVHCKMLFVTTLRLCVWVVLSVSKVLAGVNMRYQIWVTFKSSCEQSKKEPYICKKNLI